MRNEDSYEARTITSESKARDVRRFAYKIAPKKEKAKMALREYGWILTAVLGLSIIIGGLILADNARTHTYFVSYSYSYEDYGSRTTPRSGYDCFTIQNKKVTNKNFEEFKKKVTRVAIQWYSSDAKITIINFQELT